MALAGAGRANRKPCISSQPDRRQDPLVFGFNALHQHRQAERAPTSLRGGRG
jgi:hypothetical protein